MEKYLRGIASGVISALMLQPGKPYSSLPGRSTTGASSTKQSGWPAKKCAICSSGARSAGTFPMGGYNTPRPRLPTGGGM